MVQRWRATQGGSTSCFSASRRFIFSQGIKINKYTNISTKGKHDVKVLRKAFFCFGNCQVEHKFTSTHYIIIMINPYKADKRNYYYYYD